MNKKAIYREAAKRCDAKDLIISIIETMNYLQIEILEHLKAENDNTDDLISAITENEIMLEQLVEKFHCRGSVDYEKQMKIERLAERLGTEVDE